MTKTSLRLYDILRGDAGAISTAGATVGLLVTTTVSGVALSSAGSMIPVAQDSAARQNAAQLATAEGLAHIMDGAFTDTQGLADGGYLPEHRPAAGPRRFLADTNPAGTCFVVISRSETGAIFFTTDKIPVPEPLTAEPTGCLSAAQVSAMAQTLERDASR